MLISEFLRDINFEVDSCTGPSITLALAATNEGLSSGENEKSKARKNTSSKVPPAAAELSPPIKNGVEEAVALVSTWITCAEIR